MMHDFIVKNRSYRRFDESKEISADILRQLVDLARLSGSGMNVQPLKYILSAEKKKNEMIFPALAWAAYLKDWDGPKEGERPSAYIIMLGDTTIRKNFGYDPGIAAQSILLGAAESGLGGCMIASVKRELLQSKLRVPDWYEILLVLALGYPAEKVVLDEVEHDGDTKYWRDEKDVHHVPKRKLDDIILKL
jgi:nitroreductase